MKAAPELEVARISRRETSDEGSEFAWAAQLGLISKSVPVLRIASPGCARIRNGYAIPDTRRDV